MSNYNALYVKYKTKYLELVGGMKRRMERPTGFANLQHTRPQTSEEIQTDILKCEGAKISEIIEGLFLGNAINAPIMCSRVGAILNMTPEDSRCSHPDHYQSYLQLPLLDATVGQDISQFFSQTNAFIDANISNGIYVHCTAGISRSATIVIAYLMWKNRWTFSNAMAFVKSKRSCIEPNIAFQQYLRMYEMQLQSGAMHYST